MMIEAWSQGQQREDRFEKKNWSRTHMTHELDASDEYHTILKFPSCIAFSKSIRTHR